MLPITTCEYPKGTCVRVFEAREKGIPRLYQGAPTGEVRDEQGLYQLRNMSGPALFRKEDIDSGRKNSRRYLTCTRYQLPISLLVLCTKMFR